jgi:hypothetical protein
MNRMAKTAVEAATFLDGEKLCEIAAMLNAGVHCTIDKVTYNGQENATLRLLFDNKDVWAIKMPINPNGKFGEDDFEWRLASMSQTASLQQCLHKHGLLVPNVHWSCLRSCSENPVGYPAVIMDWIDGQPLDWEAIAHRPDAKTKVLSQLAEYIFSLSTLTESSEALKDLQELQKCTFAVV